MKGGVLALMAAGAVSGSVAGAQQPPPPNRGPARPGETVELRVRGRDPQGRRIECDATVSAVAGDTVVIQNIGRWYPCPSQSYAGDQIERLRVMRGHRGSRLGHAGLGLAIGAVAGGAAGRVLAGTGCQSGSSCDDGDLAIAVLTFLGAVTGGTTGLIIGAALPAGPQWVTLPASTVRVAGINVQPGVQLRVGGR